MLKSACPTWVVGLLPLDARLFSSNRQWNRPSHFPVPLRTTFCLNLFASLGRGSYGCWHYVFAVSQLRETSIAGRHRLQHHATGATPASLVVKKRRKSRTAFTSYQLQQLERCFSRQKYLLPADRDVTARRLGLSSAQVITWFQNRRAKLKRDLEELRADVDAAKSLTS